MHDVQDLPVAGQHRLQEQLHHHQEPSLQGHRTIRQGWRFLGKDRELPSSNAWELDWMFMLQVYCLLHEHGIHLQPEVDATTVEEDGSIVKIGHGEKLHEYMKFFDGLPG
ncbi:putative diaminopimelate decarboxylase, chloroplastic [Zea mays]|uniref:Putative diaminopimelate decarboxylase, chloroplastic n=1 Tax=Zea mays TaxID=4577 RepID=A0A3L6EDD8_MAIZE|nr:putative diaminopimelate decarboxylase, chloroplastic [Zea mays]